MLLDALRKRQHDGNDLPCLLDLQNQQDEDKEDEGEIISEEEDDGDDDDDNVIAEGPIPSSGRSLKLIKDICTRWNSTLYMLQRCLLLKNAINHVLAESKYANLVPTGEQWLAAEKLCALIKPFQISTDFLQGEIYPTLGSVSWIITTLVQGLQGAMPPVHWQLRARWSDLPIIVQQVRSFILKDMRARWNPSDLLLCMGVITHPGHKSLSWLNPADKNRIVQQLKTEMINVLGVNPATAEEDGSEEAEPPAKKPACSAEEEDFNLLFGQKEDEGLEPVEADDLLKELERYLKTAETNFRSDDPLLWWRNHESCFPTIAKLARKYLSIPASTAPAERVFSTAKNIVQKKRWRILPERLCTCIFLRQNKKTTLRDIRFIWRSFYHFTISPASLI